MKAYISGKLSVAQNFLLQNVWFANDDADETDVPNENCVGLEAYEVDTWFNEENPTVFEFRWKDVDLLTVDEDGEETCISDWTVNDLVSMIKEKGLSIKNLSGFVDEDTEVVITGIKLVGEDGEFEFTEEMLEMEPVEFFV